MFKLLIVVFIFAAAAGPVSAMRIKNEFMEASVDGSTLALTLQSLPHKVTFVAGATLVDGSGSPRVVSVSDPAFGKGQAIEMASETGTVEVMLYPKLPFALIRRTLTNPGTEVAHFRQADTLVAPLKLGTPASDLVLLGTGGRKSASESVGSFEWMAVGEPYNRRGVVAGWLTHDKSYGVIFSKAEGESVCLTAQSDFGNLNVRPGASVRLETLAIGFFGDVRLGLEAWADSVAKAYDIQLPPLPTGYCTWYHAGASNEKDIVKDSEIAAAKLKPYGFDFMQIDDGWQGGDSNNGPHKNFTRVRPGGSYAGGMQPVAEAISGLGLTPGIWFMPFSGNQDCPWWADKQHFFFKTADGTPFSTNWSGTLVDMSNPDAEKYLREEVKRIKDWGYRYFKLDGLHSGNGSKQTYPNMWHVEDNFGEAIPSNPYKTNIEVYRDALRTVREVAGPDVFLLGCCAPQNMSSYGGTFGLVDAMRIGPDNGGSWGAWMVSPRASTVQYFTNGRIWYNDPDPVYVRRDIPMEQARAMCSWQAVTGTLTVVSDAFRDLPEERMDLIRRMVPTHRAVARPVDLLETDLSRVWLVTDVRKGVRRDVIGLFNWLDQPSRFEYEMSYIGLDPQTTYAAYDYWSGEFFACAGKLDLPLAPTSCRILAVRPMRSQPFVISTSRHVTQGIVDVLEEKWDPVSKTLSGRSLVVGGDPYELRIVTGAGIAGVSVSLADRTGGVKITEGLAKDGLARVTISSPENREVAWEVRFVGTNLFH